MPPRLMRRRRRYRPNTAGNERPGCDAKRLHHTVVRAGGKRYSRAVVPLARVGLPMALALCACISGCNQGGGIHVSIELPTDPSLSPISAGMTRLDLHAEADGQPLATVSRNLGPLDPG